jgi:hypothetical protein
MRLWHSAARTRAVFDNENVADSKMKSGTVRLVYPSTERSGWWRVGVLSRSRSGGWGGLEIDLLAGESFELAD